MSSKQLKRKVSIIKPKDEYPYIEDPCHDLNNNSVSYCSRGCGGVRFQMSNSSPCHGPFYYNKRAKAIRGSCWMGDTISVSWLLNCSSHIHQCSCGKIFYSSNKTKICDKCKIKETTGPCIVCGKNTEYKHAHPTAVFYIYSKKMYMGSEEFVCTNDSCFEEYTKQCKELLFKPE